MDIQTHGLTIQTQGFADIQDITPHVEDLVHREGLHEGSVLLFVPGATAGLTTIEYESGAVSDLRDAIERMAPQTIPYAHVARWGDGNGFSHVRSALVGPSVTVPVSGGSLVLGTWQQVVVLCHDNRPRKRKIVVQLLGTD